MVVVHDPKVLGERIQARSVRFVVDPEAAVHDQTARTGPDLFEPEACRRQLRVRHGRPVEFDMHFSLDDGTGARTEYRRTETPLPSRSRLALLVVSRRVEINGHLGNARPPQLAATLHLAVDFVLHDHRV